MVLESEMERVDVYMRVGRDGERMGDDGDEKEVEVLWGGLKDVEREERLNDIGREEELN